ncbi:swr complex subunit [Microsporum canis]|uniref:SWR1-complex protein 5 n=1 Tax=Arthroderma otae (strain ATCC MYA-4605 / CBS 113480) TaxID=554155 RepID=C5FBD1_ARTOC|nr:SWR1-complex protein 5 [Microsporum canis CBS 113480]EEQ27115.1 SWR1-complex protein 5 [Microsporum canis CBS 113480]
MGRATRINAEYGEKVAVGDDSIPHDGPQPYNSEEDSDFDEHSVAQGVSDEGESASEDEENDKDVDGERPRKKRKLSVERQEAEADSDEEFAEAELESGDEAMIKHAKEKAEKRRRKKAADDTANTAVGSSGDDLDLDDDDEGGEGGFVRTRGMRMKVQEEKKSLARIDGATIDVDSIWKQMNKPQTVPLTDNETGTESAVTGPQTPQNASSSKLPQEEMLTIRRTYKFAGETITEEKVVPKDSAEAKLYLSTSGAARKKAKGGAGTSTDGGTDSPPDETVVQPLRRPLRRFSRFDPNPPDAIKKSWEKQAAVQAPEDAGATAKGPKLNTVMKSKLDWAAYVDREGIKDDLDVHSKAKEGYMDRMDFLGRVDAKREEERRNARLKNAGY